jgi:hypothetical protein
MGIGYIKSRGLLSYLLESFIGSYISRLRIDYALRALGMESLEGFYPIYWKVLQAYMLVDGRIEYASRAWAMRASGTSGYVKPQGLLYVT